MAVLAIRNEIDMIESGKLDKLNNPLKVSFTDITKLIDFLYRVRQKVAQFDFFRFLWNGSEF